MKPSILSLALAALLPLGAHAGTFNWHGELMDGDAPADGAYDLRVRSFSHPGAKAMLGEPTELPGVMFHDGSFSVSLEVPDDADGITWVEGAVRKAGSGDDYVVLGEPQPVSKANSTCPGAWALDGNSGIPAGSFLGFVDNKPLVLKANTTAVATFTPRGTASNYGDAPSVAFGSAANVASAPGATVGGGGSTSDVDGNACPLCKNTASGGFSAVGGGWSVVAGGLANCAGGENSWAGGWKAKIRPGSESGAAGAGCSGIALSGDSDGDEGSFVWADNLGSAFTTTGPNQFLIRASGGVSINTATLGAASDLGNSELVIQNRAGGPDSNVDVLLMPDTHRGYNLAALPGAGGNPGEFFISEVDARTGFVGYSPKFKIGSDGITYVQGGAVSNLSDARLKKNIAPITRPLDTLLGLHGRMFEYIDPAKSMNAPGPRMGFIAQEVQQVLPSWVSVADAEGHLSVATIGFEALAVEAIRDLKAESDVRIEQLEAENAALRTEISRLRTEHRHQLDALSARLSRIESQHSKPK